MDKFTYIPNPIDTSEIVLDDDIIELSEKIAKNVHEVWAKKRIEEGWKYGAIRNEEKKEHPCLIPYEELPEQEKEYDRETFCESFKVLLKLGYKIEKGM